MNNSDFSASPPMIPLASNEAFWEWDLATDNIYFSEGAKKLLKFNSLPDKMSVFLKYVKADNLPHLIDIRSRLIQGRFTGVAEYDYYFNDITVHEYLFTLARNHSGYATRLLARLSTSPELCHPLPVNPHAGEIAKTGVWVFQVSSGKIWRDKICSAILGFSHETDSLLNRASSIINVHHTERAALERHYELFINGDLLGDTITDIVRVKHAKGHYMSVLVRASVVERDENGKALLLTGLMAPASHEHIDDPISRDDRLFHALNSMGVGQWNWDAKKGIIWFCPRYLAILGYPSQDYLSFRDRWRFLVHPDDLAKIEDARNAIIESPLHGDTFECTYRMKNIHGEWVWLFDRGCVTSRDPQGRAMHMVGSITNITTAQAERDKLEELVRHDSLTGLRSRAFCNLEIEHIEQNHIRPVSVISVDITGLKMVNDSMGHAYGDKLLQKASSILQGALRASDFIARTGGDEFLVLLPNCDKLKGEKLLYKIMGAFDAFNEKNTNLPVFAACGLACAADLTESVPAAIARADQDMYQRKRESRHHDQGLIRNWIQTHTGKKVAVDDRIGDICNQKEEK